MADDASIRSFETSATQGAGVRPSYLSHVVLNTDDVPRLSAWYRLVLCAESMFVQHPMAGDGDPNAQKLYDFATFDDEHHRVAFVNARAIAGETGPAPERPAITPFNHMAFTYASLPDMIRNWKNMRDHGILPSYTRHSGLTICNNYYDPDGNKIELQCDVFDTPKELADWFASGEFSKHHGRGASFDFAHMAQQFDDGADVQWLRANKGYIAQYGEYGGH